MNIWFKLRNGCVILDNFYSKIQKKMQQNRIPDGQRTKVIYTLIKDGKYQDVELLWCRL